MHGQRTSAYRLSNDKTCLIDLTVEDKRAGKRPVYFSQEGSQPRPDATTSNQTFQEFLQSRAVNGEVALYPAPPPDTAEDKRLRKMEKAMRLRELVMKVAAEDRVESRLTTIILDFIFAIRLAQRLGRLRANEPA